MNKLDNTILQSNRIQFVQSEAQTSIFTWLQTSPQFEARYWKKLENPSDGIDFVWLYYWDGQDEKQNVGWWFADEIGSEKVSTSVGSLWSKCIKQIAYNYKTNKHSIMKHKKYLGYQHNQQVSTMQCAPFYLSQDTRCMSQMYNTSLQGYNRYLLYST